MPGPSQPCHKSKLTIVLSSVQSAEEFALNPAGAASAEDSRAASWVEALFRAHYPRLTRMLARLTGDRGQAAEIAADVFQQLARRPALLAGGAGLAAWVVGVAH